MIRSIDNDIGKKSIKGDSSFSKSGLSIILIVKRALEEIKYLVIIF